MKQLLMKPVWWLAFSLSFSHLAQANDWWFDVEVVLYKQDQSLETLSEHFEQPAGIDISGSTDLLSTYLRPDIRSLRDNLQLCDSPPHAPPTPVRFELPQTELEPLLKQIETVQQQRMARQSLRTAVNTNSAKIVGRLPGAQDSQTQPLSVGPHFQPSRWMRADCVFSVEQRYLADIPSPPERQQPLLKVVPQIIDEIERRFANQPYLLPASEFTLRDIARDLHRQRGIRPLLHLAWRQPVLFGRNQAEKFRLFAGKNFAMAYDSLGYPLEEETASTLIEDSASSPDTGLIQKVEAALSQPLILTQQDAELPSMGEQTDALWELDGWFRVYLQYINRVPYLHIDSELVYRAEGPLGLMDVSDSAMDGDSINIQKQSTVAMAPQYHLYTLPFAQLRRVISTQIHYFDHPMFGMVVQIRRYHKPDPDTEDALAE
ncbi:CsiV family protein [Lacimicrobium sp. SS2-24]|uniref:CsiV family protein n=1 Tax=Lacimicrobium sp. SS2-24 TaxID=2005569 RepID=UPI000B4BD035|nr:CsiV family protein [Lacimicrobium sp. SS2-24]